MKALYFNKNRELNIEKKKRKNIKMKIHKSKKAQIKVDISTKLFPKNISCNKIAS